MEQTLNIAVDPRNMTIDEARVQIDQLVFKEPPADKFEKAARNSFMDLTMILMADGVLVKL